MAQVAEQYADKVIVTNDNPRTENARQILADIVMGFSADFVASVTVEHDRAIAIKLAIDAASKGDIILLAGKGHENYQIIGDTKFDFDDKQIALEILRK